MPATLMALDFETSLDKTHAIVAPGQASIEVGKGLLLHTHSPAARQTWADTDRLLGYPLSELALFGRVNGEEVAPSVAMERLTNTENAQPTVITTSLAEMAVLQEHSLLGKKYPYWHSGHSVGLLVGLFTSEALDAEGAVKLADARRRAFKYAIEHGPKGGSGFLAVTNDKPELVNQYVLALTDKYPLTIALINYPNQIVLAGARADLDEAVNYVRRQDPRMASLLKKPPVEAAYHSHFMAKAVPIYEEAVDGLKMQEPTRGVLVAGSMVDEDGSIHGGRVHVLETVPDIKEALVKQLTATERWSAVINFLISQGVTRITELNESPSLSSWVRRTFPGERPPINLPGVVTPDDKPVVVAWDWKAAVPAELPAAMAGGESDETDEMNAEVAALMETYTGLTETEDATLTENFLKLEAPRTFGGMLLWYRKWFAIRAVTDLEEVSPDSDLVKDLDRDSLDFETLRSDVEMVFQNPVDEKEAAANTTPRLCAIATWEKKKKLKID